ncbi:Alpha/beta hydrolase family protein [Gimesia panareensis]|uniref:Alpha/beta hydrolase family protein n=1 Tax=Gimesia panareensis TaxID=2527978 RepID=A0A517Q1D8_9PLAN|nr:alpha/beta hydrolase-fold protein [Gimesia panareensis]QDT25449.1 Alpha/beta hydrolase family protein [Gimesia panareensis]
MQTLRTRFLFAFHTALIVCCLALLSTGPALQAQTKSAAKEPASTAPVKTGFVNAVFKDKAGEHRYVVFVPHDYSPAKKYPVILFLHGAGERGNDGLKQTQVGLGPMIKQQEKTFPFIVVFPQAEDMKERLLEGWLADSPDGKRALQILNQVMQNYSVNSNRQILTGWSMGGYGAWSMAAAFPNRWSAVAPLSGGGKTAWASELKDVPIWAFHGAQDRVVLPEESEQMIDAIKKAGGQPRFTLVPDVGHDVWKVAYTKPLFDWMQNPTLQIDPSAPLLVKPDRKLPAEVDSETPFVPALIINDAVSVRLGNRFLQSLADAVPSMVPPDMLEGNIADINDWTTAQGRDFSVQFSGISYKGELARAAVEAYAAGTLNIQLGIQNVDLYISNTYVTGNRHAAVAGPISVSIGHQRPVWLSFDVQPYIQGQSLKLKLLRTRFTIPQNNWYVSGPAGVSTRGIGMTAEKVSSGLIDGIYGSKGRIEAEVKAIVPGLVDELEKQLNFSEASQVVDAVWPLPVYHPRIKLWPREVVTDIQGVSLNFGLTVASLDATKPSAGVKQINAFGTSVNKIPKVTELQVGVAPGILKPLTEMLVEDDVARIPVLDIPGHSFDPLADAKTLQQVFPDLKQYGDDIKIWSELVLTRPIQVEDSNKPKSASDDPFRFVVPRAAISMAIKKSAADKNWTPYAEFSLSLSQDVDPEIFDQSFSKRAIRLDWEGDSRIGGLARFAPDYKPQDKNIDQAKLRLLVQAAWDGWTKQGPASVAEIPDIELGFGRYRIQQVKWAAPQLLATFSVPELKITNNTKQEIEYELKSPYSDWGGPYKLKPGDSHVFDAAMPLTYRRKIDGQMHVFTLASGSHFEFLPEKDHPEGVLYEASDN